MTLLTFICELQLMTRSLVEIIVLYLRVENQWDICVGQISQ